MTKATKLVAFVIYSVYYKLLSSITIRMHKLQLEKIEQHFWLVHYFRS